MRRFEFVAPMLLITGCTQGTTGNDRLPEVATIEIHVRYDDSDTPAEDLKVEITRLFPAATLFTNASMIPIYVGNTDAYGAVTYRTQLNGTNEIWVRGRDLECWDGGYHRIESLEGSRIIEAVLRPC